MWLGREIRDELQTLDRRIQDGLHEAHEDSRQMREDFARLRELERQILVEVVESRERARAHHDLQIDVMANLAAEIRGWRQEGPGGAPA